MNGSPLPQRKQFLCVIFMGYKFTPNLSSCLNFLHAEEDVNAITVDLSIKHSVYPFYANKFTLCGTEFLSCPVKAGRGFVPYKYVIPEFESLVSVCVCVCVPGGVVGLMTARL